MMGFRLLPLLLIAGAPSAGMAQLTKTNEVPVHVNDCYAADDDLQVAVDGRPLELVPPDQRSDAIALCFVGELGIGEEVVVEVESSRAAYRVVVRREDRKTLAISALSAVLTGFRDPRTLIYD